MRSLSFVLCVSLFAGGLGCGDDDDSGPLRVGTYNGGLALGFVDYTEARAPLVAQATAELDADLLCVQELWRQEDWDRLTAAMSDTHPHTLRRPAEPDEGNTCAEGELDAVDICVRASCDGVPADMLANCALDNCGPELDGLSTGCLNCLIGNVGTGDLDTIRATCEMGGSSYAYEGSFGTGILSRLPLADEDSLLLESTANRRAVLYARVPNTPQGDVHFFCTHLTANLSAVPYTGPAGSWEAEQTMQIQDALAWIDAKSAGGRVIVAGDLNSGPALPGITAELPANWEMWTAAGFSAPYAEQAETQCTFCDSNPLNLGTMGGEGGLIDHVLLRGFDADATGERVLDETVTIEADGSTVTTALSDHYGLIVTIE